MLKKTIASAVMATATHATRARRSQRPRRVAPGDGVLILPFPRPCSLVLSVTTPLYRRTVSQALRQTLRGKGYEVITPVLPFSSVVGRDATIRRRERAASSPSPPSPG